MRLFPRVSLSPYRQDNQTKLKHQGGFSGARTSIAAYRGHPNAVSLSTAQLQCSRNQSSFRWHIFPRTSPTLKSPHLDYLQTFKRLKTPSYPRLSSLQGSRLA